ncbi:Oidioi.mRNA.OKI2018_I69.chr2.g4563.t1.cds [Oikopleura dioica]|uniref:Oidioi.mRNA.OKI2018_I69.chr2.g4563.t1.cds n=1 Tax=Oikopleura dioica TaxID=34765 RepID=A0ABN7T487_OIKDI|nr:Oidioi.mRNA.OKI2018_I69.chr2.g4563.t1.cds [Oikopleura dioica]
MQEDFMTQENLQDLVNGQLNGTISTKKLSSVAPETSFQNGEVRNHQNGGHHLTGEEPALPEYEPPPDLDPAELREENFKRELPSDLWVGLPD